MATAETSAFIPLETYLHTCYEPDVEYVDGQLEERNVGEFDHNMIQRAVSVLVLFARKRVGYPCDTEATHPHAASIDCDRSPVPGRSALSGCRKDQELHEVWRATYLDCGLKDT